MLYWTHRLSNALSGLWMASPNRELVYCLYYIIRITGLFFFNRVSQCHPFFRMILRLSRLEYQLSRISNNLGFQDGIYINYLRQRRKNGGYSKSSIILIYYCQAQRKLIDLVQSNKARSQTILFLPSTV
jgi:hypothetical protein